MDFITVAWQKLQALFDLAFAGALGALLSLPFHPDVKTFSQRALVVASGSAFAHYVTPLALDYFGTSIERSGSVAFIFGLFGMSITAAIMNAIQHIDLAAIAKSWIPGRGE